VTPTPADHPPDDERDALGSFAFDDVTPERRRRPRREEDAWREEITYAVRDLAARVTAHGPPPTEPPEAAAREPFWRRWTVTEWGALLVILGSIFGGGLGVARWVARTASAPVVDLRNDFAEFRRGTEQWREGFADEIRDVRFDVCVAGKLASESECVRTVYRTTPAQQRVDSARRALPEDP
jgi:hypothetical protein